jgi:hypothetical protein
MESLIDVVHVYRRIHAALDSDDLAQAVSNLQSDLAVKFFNDTGTKIGPVAFAKATGV